MATGAVVAREVRNSFDLWAGVPASELINSVSLSSEKQCTSMQQHAAGSNPLPAVSDLPAGALELLSLLQRPQCANDRVDSPEEQNIDSHILQLLQLRQLLHLQKQAANLPAYSLQAQQVIHEDMALAVDDFVGHNSLYNHLAPAGLVSQAQAASACRSFSTIDPPTGTWSNRAATAAAHPSRSSVDMGSLAQQLAAWEMHCSAAAALAPHMPPSANFSDLHARLSLDVPPVTGPMDPCLDELMAAMAMASAPPPGTKCPTPCRTSFSDPAAGLLDSSILHSADACGLGAAVPVQPPAAAAALASGTMLAMQSALYNPAPPHLPTQLQVPGAPATLLGHNTAVPSPHAHGPATSPQAFARHSLDCSLLGGAFGLTSPGPYGAAAAAAAHPTGLPSPGAGRRASFHVPPAHRLTDGTALSLGLQPPQLAAEAAGWSRSSSSGGGGGGGVTSRSSSRYVRRASSELPRLDGSDVKHPVRKVASALAPPGSCPPSPDMSSLTTAHSSPCSIQLAPQGRTSFDAPAAGARTGRSTPPGASAAKKHSTAEDVACTADQGGLAAVTAAPGTASVARRGTGVFIPPSMIKS